MDLIQIITILLCVGSIAYLSYQLKELYYLFQDSENFKDFLSNKDFVSNLKDYNYSLKNEIKNLEDELKTYRDCMKDNIKVDKITLSYITKLEAENRKLKKKLPSNHWLMCD